MGRTLNMTVIAGGVETAEQAAFLRERGWDEFQGFYFSKVVSAADIVQLLDAQRVQKDERLSHSGSDALAIA